MKVPTQLVVSRVVESTGVLGPGLRAAVWVRGCPLRCAGCLSTEDLPFTGGVRLAVPELADQLNALPPEVTGVTFSGGEPMAQAAALAELVDLLRAARPWSVMSYSGFTLEYLRRHGTADQSALLDRLDILVDGPYLRERHAALRWRGSANQGLHFLTGRHGAPPDDTTAGLELTVAAGAVSWVGVPAQPHLRERFEAAMAAGGVPLVTHE